MWSGATTQANCPTGCSWIRTACSAARRASWSRSARSCNHFKGGPAEGVGLNPTAGRCTPGVLQEARDQYCEAIFTTRLYAHVPTEAQTALSRAVYELPVDVPALAAAAGMPVEQVRSFTGKWRDYALAHPEREKATTELWTVYPLQRGWLLDQLGEEERRAAHAAARDRELGLNWVAQPGVNGAERGELRCSAGEVRRLIGNRAGEAGTFAPLGIMAAQWVSRRSGSGCSPLVPLCSP
jgi:hypothetical protein